MFTVLREAMSGKHLTHCPICNSQEFTTFLECKDYTVSLEIFTVVSCNSCSFKFTNPRPETSDLGKYYESEDYISHSNTRKGLINFMYQLVRNHTLLKKLKLINSLSAKGKLLDIGCGTGEFLAVCKRAKWEVSGIEVSEKARAFARSTYQLDVQDEPAICELQTASYDVVTMWHVLEHVPNLQERIEEMKSLLKDDGTLLIAVPNCSSKDARKYGAYWAAYDVPRHLYHFAPDTIERLFKPHGMHLKRILPMPFDAFYVSMLSEQYKHGKSIMNFFKGMLVGLHSNIAAMSGGKTYSSQIYIIKK